MEFVAQASESMFDGIAAVAEFATADDRCDAELTLAVQGFRIDQQPWLALRCEHVAGVQVLIDDNVFTLRSWQVREYVDRGVEELPWERLAVSPPVVFKRRQPVRGFVGK